MLRKALKPPRYNLGIYKIYRYNGATECACCGVDVRRFVEGDNAYSHIIDDDTGLSLADLYWMNEDGSSRKPHARTQGDHGDELNSTLSPAHLHIYHTFFWKYVISKNYHYLLHSTYHFYIHTIDYFLY